MDQTYDRMFYHECYNLGGVDEVGVTALAGPIVAACVVLPRLTTKDNLSLFLIDDSKKIHEKYRHESARIVQEQALAYGIGSVLPSEIDALNVVIASNLAMRRAVLDCQKRFGNHSVDMCLIDGNREIDLGMPHKLIVKGDMKSLSIAAASILAKVHRDLIMRRYDSYHPEYGFVRNKGYKCEEHFKGLDSKGLWVGVHRSTVYPLSKKKNDSKEQKERRRLWMAQTEANLFKGEAQCALNLIHED